MTWARKPKVHGSSPATNYEQRWVPRGELSKCLWSEWEWYWGVKEMLPLSPAVLWFVNVRERKPTQKKKEKRKNYIRSAIFLGRTGTSYVDAKKILLVFLINAFFACLPLTNIFYSCFVDIYTTNSVKTNNVLLSIIFCNVCSSCFFGR